MSSSNFSSLLSLPVKAGKHTPRSHLSAGYTRVGRLPSLITRANTASYADGPRVTAVTVDAHRSSAYTLSPPHASAVSETGVYQTLQSATRFAIVIPLSIQAAPFQPLAERHTDTAVICSPPRPKRGITIQRLGMQTPTPPWAVRYMLARGGGRFSLMSRMEFHRPASERLAAQHMEGEGDYLDVVPQETHTRHTLDNELAPEQFKLVKRLVVERISPCHLETMNPLKQALHNVLAHAMDLKPLTSASIRPKRHVRNPRAGSAKSEAGQRMRRTRPAIAPLDMDAVRTYRSANPLTDSPPESPGPQTPPDDFAAARKGSKEACPSGDKVVTTSKSKQKSAVNRTFTKGKVVKRSNRLF